MKALSLLLLLGALCVSVSAQSLNLRVGNPAVSGSGLSPINPPRALTRGMRDLMRFGLVDKMVPEKIKIEEQPATLLMNPNLRYGWANIERDQTISPRHAAIINPSPIATPNVNLNPVMYGFAAEEEIASPRAAKLEKDVSITSPERSVPDLKQFQQAHEHYLKSLELMNVDVPAEIKVAPTEADLQDYIRSLRAQVMARAKPVKFGFAGGDIKSAQPQAKEVTLEDLKAVHAQFVAEAEEANMDLPTELAREPDARDVEIANAADAELEERELDHDFESNGRGFGGWGFGFRPWGFGFGGFRPWGFGFGGFRPWGFGWGW